MGDLITLPSRLTALEFFSGIGLARAGMQRAGVRTVWANDIDRTKCELYSAQWGDDELLCGDVHAVDAARIPHADIAWGSSPCTDLSLAGKRNGLVDGRESSAFFGFTQALRKMGSRRPRAVILENVTGLASSHDGNDFRMVVEEFNDLGYSVDALEVDARRWLPQSRPRMFVIGLINPIDSDRLSSSLRPDRVAWIHSDSSLVTHVTPLPEFPKLMSTGFTKLAERVPDGDARWWNKDRLAAFTGSLSDVQQARLKRLVAGSSVVARTAYRRTRGGFPVWEIRGDDIAGCLRTARGGSSRQAVVVAGRRTCKVRWMTGTEYVRLQGADGFAIEGFRDSQIRYAFGDAVAVPAVSWLVSNAVLPALRLGREGGYIAQQG